MAIMDTKKIRNIVLLGHGGCGKTSLAEAMLYISGGTDRLGKIADGNTVCDYDSEEVSRGFSLSLSMANLTWKDVKVNLLDTPGYLDFNGEALQAVRVADSAIIVMDAKAGIEVGTELAWDVATAAGLPKAFFINKFDDNEARFGKVLDALHEKFGKAVCPLTIPMVKNGEVVGAIDLIEQNAHVFDKNGRHSIEIIPDESKEATDHFRDMLMEAVASTDEDLMMKYFEGEEIGPMEAFNAIHEGIIHGDIIPVLSADTTSLDSFIGYQAERQRVIDNTLAFLEGRPGANVLLYGDAGTGKSSTVKAIANHFFDCGLRLLEVRKNQLLLLPKIMGEISKNPLKFIIFIDDLSFNQNDDCFSMLKATLEGSASVRAKNAIIYATSNRRHIVKESFGDREGTEVHRNDTIQETISLSERFGLTVLFSKPPKALYLEIINQLAKKHNIKMDKNELETKAEAFALSRGYRSPRCAEQFIDSLI